MGPIMTKAKTVKKNFREIDFHKKVFKVCSDIKKGKATAFKKLITKIVLKCQE